MITVTVKRQTGQRTVQEVSISGNAHYDDYGKDIVCAAVSSVSINIINAAEALLNIPLETEERDGTILCRVPELREAKKNEHVQLLMETLVYSLKSIAEEYPSFVLIRE